jgi:hypothetical protein
LSFLDRFLARSTAVDRRAPVIVGHAAPQPLPSFRPKKGAPVGEVPVFNAAGIIEGAGPEQDQIRHARLDFNAAAMGVPVVNGTMGGRPITRSWSDASPAQTFPSRIRAKDLAPPAPLNAQVTAAHLPGRVQPSMWDGEPGGTSPNLQGYF